MKKVKQMTILVAILFAIIQITNAQEKATAPKQGKTATKKNAAATNHTKDTLVINQSDNKKTIQLKKQQVIKVVFKNECVGCQYVWTLKEYDDKMISKVDDYRINRSCENCTGGSSDHIFLLKPQKSGKTKILFSYSEAFSVNLVIK